SSVTFALAGGLTLAEGETYTITVSGVADLAGNIIADSQMQFRAWVTTTCGGLTMEIYNGTSGDILIGLLNGGTAISALTNDATFPDRPSVVLPLTGAFDTLLALPASPDHDNYGAR